MTIFKLFEDPKAYVKAIHSANNSIIKALGQSDTELGTAIYTNAQGSQDPQVVQPAYIQALATFIGTREAAGKLAHIQVDASIPNDGTTMFVGAILTVRPNNA